MSSIYDLENIADILQKNTYPGRGIIIGKTANGKKAAIAYFIMGRSENSRNRIFIENGAELVIHPYDRSKVEDPSLIIYSPIRCLGNRLIVTNGDQTDTIYEYIKQGKSFTDALSTRCFEPDAPNFTPRISGNLSAAVNQFGTGKIIKLHNGGKSQQPSEVDIVAGFFAVSGNNADSRCFVIDYTDCNFIGDNAAYGFFTGISGNGNHVKTDRANGGHCF